ncbi:MAG: FKBP-type peptidyl-prolyl cis-trans isomerase, partial [Bacteroidales bacterium]|nr:FKBP-type peptidyl-prolyl cis-trans isomerase [Bacteroidales bacterium]
SGLQYEVFTQGQGEKPSLQNQVTVHYHGTLIDGTVFDSSVQRGEPATFPVNGVIQGWQEVIPMMNTGSKWRVFIPSDLAYGERGAGNAIPPHTPLVFDIELISIS